MGENEKSEGQTLLQVKVDNAITDALDQRAAANDRTRAGEVRAILKDALGVNTVKEG